MILLSKNDDVDVQFLWMFTKKKLFKQLTVLGKLYFKKIKGEEKISEEPPNKKKKTSQGMMNTHT